MKTYQKGFIEYLVYMPWMDMAEFLGYTQLMDMAFPNNQHKGNIRLYPECPGQKVRE